MCYSSWGNYPFSRATPSTPETNPPKLTWVITALHTPTTSPKQSRHIGMHECITMPHMATCISSQAPQNCVCESSCSWSAPPGYLRVSCERSAYLHKVGARFCRSCLVNYLHSLI